MFYKALKKNNFSLIEVLVALCIISICFAVYMQALRINIDNTAVSQSYITACLLANKELAKLSKNKKLKEGKKEGEFGDKYPTFKWTLDVKKGININEHLFKTKLDISFERNGQKRVITFRSLLIDNESLKKKDSDKNNNSSSSNSSTKSNS